VIRPVCLLADRQRALEQRLDLVDAVLHPIGHRQFLQRRRHVRMIGAERIFADRQRALE
jgi:hypothetical protein